MDRRDSYLGEAMLLDRDLYEANLGRPKPAPRKAPHLREVGLTESLLMGIHDRLEKLVNLTGVVGKVKPKPPKPKMLPRPETAEDIVRRESQRRAYDELMGEIVFVSNEHYAQTVATADDQSVVRRHLR